MEFLRHQNKYVTLLNLYLAQSIPMSFFSTVLPVIMRMEQYSLTSIGLIQLIKLPWILKFLWAPIVDKSTTSLGKYKRWIIFSELFYAIIVMHIGFFNLETDFTTIIALMVIAFTASATQDIATDAFAIHILKKDERSTGNSMQSAGSFLGTLTGSGVLLIIYHYWGWYKLLMGLSGFVVLALIPLYFYTNKEKIETKEVPRIKYKELFKFFTQKGIGVHILFISIIYSGFIGILTMLKPWLVDLGYNVKEIGMMSGVYGAASGAACAFLSGMIVKKFGKKKSLLAFSGLGLLTAIFFYIHSHFVLSTPMVMFGILFVWGTYGMLTVLIYTLAMEKVRPGFEGTDFTIQIVITHLSSLIISVGSGKFTQVFGYQGLFLTESIIAILILFYIILVYNKTLSSD